jgi:hypothetical protein
MYRVARNIMLFKADKLIFMIFFMNFQLIYYAFEHHHQTGAKKQIGQIKNDFFLSS